MSVPVAREVLVFDDVTALIEAAAEIVVACAVDAMRDGGSFSLALSGGSTPKSLYQLLATDAYARRIDWPRVELFWGDERCVPPGDPASNYRMVRESLLDRVALVAANVHRIAGEAEPLEAAASYERDLRAAFATPAGPPRTRRGSRLDLVLLGLGADGHTASLFPGTAAVRESERWVVAHRVRALSSWAIPGRGGRAWRITLTPVVLNAAAEVLFLVTGREKAAALHRVLEGPFQPEELPAQAIAPRCGRVRWLVDAAAADSMRD